MEIYGFSASNTTNNFYATATQRNKLWIDSQITGKCVAPHLSFSKQKRFKWSSIYWPENCENLFATKKKKKTETNQIATKISKLIDDEEKNQVRIKQIKHTFSMGKSQIGSPRKESASTLSTKKPFKLSKQNERIINKLKAIQAKKQSLLRDRHGNRSNLYQNPQLQLTQQDVKIEGMTTGFSTSLKMKLDLPHNYFPGPGTYEIKRYLAELDPKSQFYQGDQSAPKTERLDK